MTKEDITKALETCILGYCTGCPYDGCDGDCRDEMHKGALNLITEQETEIERLKAEFKQLETNTEILASGVRDLNHENYELTEKVKQAQIDMLNRVMTYINDKIENDYGDMSDSVNYLTIDIDDFDDFIDELIKEVENGEDKG